MTGSPGSPGPDGKTGPGVSVHYTITDNTVYCEDVSFTTGRIWSLHFNNYITFNKFLFQKNSKESGFKKCNYSNP